MFTWSLGSLDKDARTGSVRVGFAGLPTTRVCLGHPYPIFSFLGLAAQSILERFELHVLAPKRLSFCNMCR